MADCSYARCMQERRTIKKRLQKWTKNCIYTLGFERVAEELMGRRQWRAYQERVLRSWCPSIERDIEVKDWDPTEDKCNFCDLEPTGRDTDESTKSPVQSDSLLQHSNNIDLLGSESSDSSEGLPGSMNTLDSVSSMAAIAALASPQGLPYYPAAGFPRWYLSPPPPARSLLDGIGKPESPMVMSLPPTPSAEMPLDLSAKSSKTPPTESPENIRVPSLIDPKPALFGLGAPPCAGAELGSTFSVSSDWSSCRSRPRMSPMSGRRTYTEDELQAALRDIQSGKLGTRRAAVIYGIPRSTLRNKVYKLALERERDAHVLLGAPLPRPSPPDTAALPPSLLQPEREESSLEEDKEGSSQPGLSMEDLLRLSGVERNPQSTVLASYLAQLLKLKENVSPGDEETSLMKRIIAEERKNGVEEDQSNVILRIPSFKPNAEPSEKPPVNGDTPEAGASIRDAIAKSITHKFQSEAPSSAAFPRHPSIHQQQQQHQHHQQQQQQRQSAQGKGTRPKRGKYRNYDRDSLVEAVRAVQRGEMSVHRAGSYYGVPHSTLEYKVKERHLMRPRKREPKTEDKTKMLPSPMPLDKGGKQPPLAPKPLVKPPFPPPNGLKLPPSLFETGVSPLATYAGAPFPFWPPHPFGHGLPLPPTPEQMFAPSLPAATRRIAESLYDGSGHNGSFLDGIIRSSLELGLKNAAEKSGKEMQHMSNKALIDQLCLNSRIPPVPPVPPVPHPQRSAEVHSDEERHVPYDLSRSSDDDSDDRDDHTKRTDDNDIQSPDEDEDMDNISNHASEEDEPADS